MILRQAEMKQTSHKALSEHNQEQKMVTLWLLRAKSDMFISKRLVGKDVINF